MSYSNLCDATKATVVHASALEHDWEREFDRWVIQTDGATILLEIAASDFIQSEDADSSIAQLKRGSYLGACMAMSTLSFVPLSVVQAKVTAMAGGGIFK